MPSVTYNLNGPKAFSFSYPIRYKSEIVLQVVPGTVVPDSQYQVIGAGPESTGVTVQWPLAPIDGTRQLVIERYVDPNRVSDFTGNGIDAVSLDSEFDHIYGLYGDVNTELDRALKWPVTDSTAYDAETRRIKSLSDPIANQDAATKGWVKRITEGIRAAVEAAEELIHEIQTLVQSVGLPKVKIITSDHTLTADDTFSILVCDNASDITVSLPIGVTAGFNCTFVRVNLGEVTFASAGILRIPAPFERKLRTIDSEASVSCINSGAGVWMLAGDLTDSLVPPGPGPGPGAPYMYVANSSDKTLSAIDVATGAVMATIGVDHYPLGIVSNGASLLYVVNPSGTVSAISAATNTVNSTIQLYTGLTAAVFVNSRYLYVSNGDMDSVTVVDTRTSTLGAVIPVGDAPTDVASDGTNVYAVNSNDGTVSVIDTSTDTVINTWPVSFGIRYAASDGAGHLYLTNNQNDQVEVLDTSTGALGTPIPVGTAPAGVAYDGSGRMYVANFGADSVSVIDTGTDTVVATIAVGGAPGYVGFDNAGLVYVTNFDGNTVSVIDPSTDTVTDTIAVGQNPMGIAYAEKP